ncbi:MAG: MarC family NAAT transporter [Chitinophagales bacterium]|nr:MarC family NAAT transporter [Chitinophagales bacterium]
MFFQVTLLAFLVTTMVNPPTTATLLLGLTHRSKAYINQCKLSCAAALTLCITLSAHLSLIFWTSIPGLRLGGGLIIGFIGFRMLFPSQATINNTEDDTSIAFVPLTMPSMCGPGTMALVISGAAQISDIPEDFNRIPIYGGMVMAFALISITSWLVLRMAQPICKFMGKTGIDALTRIMGFLLISMGMQFMINGIKDLLADPAFRVFCTIAN